MVLLSSILAPVHSLSWEAGGALECSKMLPKRIRILIAFLGECSPDSEIVPKNWAVHNAGVYSRGSFVSRQYEAK